MKYPPFSIIVGYRGSDRAIGKDGKLPWKIPKDMQFFRRLTKRTDDGKKNVVIMGRNTFESLNYKPLTERINIVCTSMDFIDMPDLHLYFTKTFEEALLKFKNDPNINKIFVIGGEQLYKYAMNHPACNEIIVNEFYPCARMPTFDIDSIVCDAFFPEIDLKKYELILDYNSIDSIVSVKTENIIMQNNSNDLDLLSSTLCNNEELYIKIRYKKYYREIQGTYGSPGRPLP